MSASGLVEGERRRRQADVMADRVRDAGVLAEAENAVVAGILRLHDVDRKLAEFASLDVADPIVAEVRDGWLAERQRVAAGLKANAATLRPIATRESLLKVAEAESPQQGPVRMRFDLGWAQAFLEGRVAVGAPLPQQAAAVALVPQHDDSESLADNNDTARTRAPVFAGLRRGRAGERKS